MLALSFAGFSAIVVTLRQALGGEGGLAVAALSLLPKALSFTGLTDATIWRLSSAAAALIFFVYLIFLLRRRRRVAPGPVPFPAALNYAISVIATLALWVNTVGFRSQASAAPYVLALTWFLVLGGWVFVQNLDLFIRQPPSP